MALRISQKYILLILIIIFSLAIIGIILAVYKNWIFLSPIEKAKENAIKQVLQDEKGNPMISQDKFQQYLLIKDSRYQIIYQKLNDTFIISVNDSPFENVRRMAEEKFLSLIDAPENIACQLKVKIVTPRLANPEFSNQVFSLSFCQ